MESVTRDERGQPRLPTRGWPMPVAGHPQACPPGPGATSAWDGRDTVPVAGGKGALKPGPFSATTEKALAAVSSRLAPLVAGDFAELQAQAVALVPHVVAGAAGALQAAGRDVSEASLAAALLLEDEDAAVAVAVALLEIATEAPADAAEAARRAGWELVRVLLEAGENPR